MTIKTSQTPYYDDFDASKDFQRILFRPGVAVQARELTQIQSLLQNQIANGAFSSLRDGSLISGRGLTTFTTRFAVVDFVSLETLETFVGKVLTGQDSGVKAVVEHVEWIDDKSVVYYRPVQGVGTFQQGEEIVAEVSDNPFLSSPTGLTIEDESEALGNGVLSRVDDSLFFLSGQFVVVSKQTIVVSPFETIKDCRIGFEIETNVITYKEDQTLLDPARGSYNGNAPGADRLIIKAVLTTRPERDLEEQLNRFVTLQTFLNGTVSNLVDRPDTSDIENRIRKSIAMSSGSFEVSGFEVSVRESASNPDVFEVVVGPGVFVLDGHEIVVDRTTVLEIDRARDVVGQSGVFENPFVASFQETGEFRDPNCPPCPCDDDVFQAPHEKPENNAPASFPQDGNEDNAYILLRDVVGAPDIENDGEVVLLDRMDFDQSYTGTQVGTARVGVFELFSETHDSDSQYRVVLYDVVMNTGRNFSRDVRSIRSTNPFFFGNIADTRQIRGTASADSSGLVSGVGTFFTQDINQWNTLYIDGNRVGRVQTIVSDTEIQLTDFAGVAVDAGGLAKTQAEFNGSRTSFLYPTGFENVKTLRALDGAGNATVRNTSVVLRRVFTATASSGHGVFVLPSADLSFLPFDPDRHMTLINRDDNTIVELDSGDVTITPTNATITGLTNGNVYELHAHVLHTNIAGGEKIKTLDEAVVDFASPDNDVLDLGIPDVLRVVDVRVSNTSPYDDTDSRSILHRYILDDGQRATHYQNAVLRRKEGAPTPEGEIRVVVEHFLHSGSGAFFSVDSYTNIDYDDIPSFEDTPLTDVFDFRPVLGDTSNVYRLPAYGFVPTASLVRYLDRVDTIALNQDGVVVFKGIPGNGTPDVSVGALRVADITIKGYTRTIEEIQKDRKNNRRFTSQDIQTLDDRLKKTEKEVVLNRLEQDVDRFTVFNHFTGLSRLKTGVMAYESVWTLPRVSSDWKMFDVDSNARTPSDRPDLFTLPWIEDIHLNNKVSTHQRSVRQDFGTIHDGVFTRFETDKGWRLFQTNFLNRETGYDVFWNGENVSNRVQPALQIVVEKSDPSDVWEWVSEPSSVASRRENGYGDVLSFFLRGDVISNASQSPVPISGLSEPDFGDETFTVSGSFGSENIEAGHHVVLYGLSQHGSIVVGNDTLPAVNSAERPDENGAELQLRVFRVREKDGGNLILENLDGSLFNEDVSEYATGGFVKRLTATGVVVYSSPVVGTEDKETLHVLNTVGGFADGDTFQSEGGNTGTVLERENAIVSDERGVLVGLLPNTHGEGTLEVRNSDGSSKARISTASFGRFATTPADLRQGFKTVRDIMITSLHLPVHDIAQEGLVLDIRERKTDKILEGSQTVLTTSHNDEVVFNRPIFLKGNELYDICLTGSGTVLTSVSGFDKVSQEPLMLGLEDSKKENLTCVLRKARFTAPNRRIVFQPFEHGLETFENVEMGLENGQTSVFIKLGENHRYEVGDVVRISDVVFAGGDVVVSDFISKALLEGERTITIASNDFIGFEMNFGNLEEDEDDIITGHYLLQKCNISKVVNVHTILTRANVLQSANTSMAFEISFDGGSSYNPVANNLETVLKSPDVLTNLEDIRIRVYIRSTDPNVSPVFNPFENVMTVFENVGLSVFLFESDEMILDVGSNGLLVRLEAHLQDPDGELTIQARVKDFGGKYGDWFDVGKHEGVCGKNTTLSFSHETPNRPFQVFQIRVLLESENLSRSASVSDVRVASYV